MGRRVILLKGWVDPDGTEHAKDFDWRDYYYGLGQQVFFTGALLAMEEDGVVTPGRRVTPLLEPGPDPKPSQRAVWTCPKADPACTRTAPCPSCRGRRNRRSGLTKQRVARKQLGVPDSRFRGQNGNEENWHGVFRAECKSGQQVKALATRFLAAEAQSESAKAVGDPRPFAFVAMPTGMGGEGLVCVRLSVWNSLIVPVLS